MLDRSGTRTLESSENKQDLTSAIGRCLAISVRESSASVITAAVNLPSCQPQQPFLELSTPGCKIPARASPETWKCWECFLFVIISYINIPCCSARFVQNTKSWLHLLKGTSDLILFAVQELHHSSNFEQFPRNRSSSAWRRIYPPFLSTEILLWLKASLKMPTLLLQYLKCVPENYKSA